MEQLKQLYKSWDDIDLIVGMLMERYLANSIIGPTAACIIKEQFIRTKLGDRHFYDQPGIMFTNGQYLYIYKNSYQWRIENFFNRIGVLKNDLQNKYKMAKAHTWHHWWYATVVGEKLERQDTEGN